MPNYWVLRVQVWWLRFLGYAVWFDVRYVNHRKQPEHYGAKTHRKFFRTLDDAWQEYCSRGAGLRAEFTVDFRMYTLLHSKRPTFFGQELEDLPIDPVEAATKLRTGHHWKARAAGVAITPPTEVPPDAQQ